MRIAVTGATGNTGAAVTGRHHVLAITRDPQGKAAQQLAELPGVVPVTLEDAFTEPVDRIYLASAVTRDQFLVETDVIIAARKAGVEYIVKLSTVDAWMEVYSDIFYARSHLAVECFLERGDIPFTCLRANLFHTSVGIDLDAVPKTNQFRTFLHGASVATIDPDDVGRAAAALLSLEDPSRHYSKKYMLTGPEDVNDQSIGEALREVLQADVTFGGTLTVDEFTKATGSPINPKSLLPPITFLRQGKGDRAHAVASPEMLALAPPKGTFKEFITQYYAKN
ncbi:NmrAlike family protein [Acanthamoeba castellanii str. Neff]|uniref:NmrAlike family protein n=1 Tax=Acanthamoeba castellanii (strain ATCC 30010 / Neff) TaxID=1257118 RepID=L8HBC2_ACACF|nr:NmrAlike family protein [Acanthamoeba castellanii str. Neff]ELR22028.1 NmrAlike family protein [Acanthamoeba castellanii str. Neff]